MFDPGDLVLIPVPFSDLSSTKRRPVIVLTAPDGQGDFVACPITSRAGWTYGHQLSPRDLIDGALPLVSWVRTDKVVTFHVGLVVRRFGRVTEGFRSAIASDVCRFLGATHAA
jgi:mRNA interferase MazF